MHRIKFVDDDDMPDGHDFVMAQVEGDFTIFYRANGVCPQVLEESWAAFNLLTARKSLSLRSVS